MASTADRTTTGVARTLPLFAALLLASLAALHPAQGVSAADIPSLDEMAGDWILMETVANHPAVHNFNHMLVVDRDLTSFFCHPGGLYKAGIHWNRGYPIVKLTVNGTEYPAAETRWHAYRALRRNQQCGGLAVETDTRMVNEQRGVLCRITITNSASKPLNATIALQVFGALQADGVGVINNTQRGGFVSVVRPARRPDTVKTETDGVCWTWAVELPAGGKVTLGFVAGDGEESLAAQTEERVAGWDARSTPRWTISNGFGSNAGRMPSRRAMRISPATCRC